MINSIFGRFLLFRLQSLGQYLLCWHPSHGSPKYHYEKPLMPTVCGFFVFEDDLPNGMSEGHTCNICFAIAKILLGIPLIEPAPMVTTTSPGLTISNSFSGIASSDSTNNGAIFPPIPMA